MSPVILQCPQGSPEWAKARLGIPTASMFSAVLAAAKDGKERKTRDMYLRKLAGELLTGDPMENYQAPDFERGKQMEAEARNFYAFTTEDTIEQVGFIRNGNKGCSPDSLIGSDGMLELKTAFPHILIDKILRDEFPPEHRAQCQGNLLVADREWIDIGIYWPKMPMFVKRAHRDANYLRNLSDEIDIFNAELHELVEKIRRYGA